jgi:DNA-binding NarL/FixJ family response regulator
MCAVTSTGSPGAPPTFVVVDDHAGFRAFARAFLEDEGFRVVGEAEDGAGALDAVARHHPDVLLLDVQLPDMGGFEVNARLRDARIGGAPAVVFVSTRDASDYGDRLARSGARGFIRKIDLTGPALHALIGVR